MGLAAGIVLGGLSAIGTATSMRSQNDAIQAQQESIAATTKLNYALKQQQEAEAKEQTSMNLTQEAIKRYAERGAVRAAQAESGVAGVSPLRELSNSYVQQAITSGSIIAKGEAQQRSLALENQYNYMQSLSQVNSLESQKASGGDIFMSSLMSGISTGISVAGMSGGSLFSSTPTAPIAPLATSTTKLGSIGIASNPISADLGVIALGQ